MSVEDFEPLQKEIIEKRGCGSTVCEIKSRSSMETFPDVDEITQFVNGIGFKADVNDWIEIRKEDAIKITSRILTADLAYDVEILPLAEAQSLSTQFLNLFTDSATFLTNGVFTAGERYEVDLRAWNPISPATFNAGIVCGSKALLGIIWVEDED
ncbi:MAG: hypothetical protein AB7H80_16040 [Candidatus Kapaibacterium sp.]